MPDIRRICRHLAKTLDPNEQGGIAIQKASVKDKIITFESSLLQVFGCGSIKMLPLKSKSGAKEQHPQLYIFAVKEIQASE